MPNCFNLNEQNFESVIKDHEYIHADHLRNGLHFKHGGIFNYMMNDMYDHETVLILDESIVYQHTLTQATKKKNKSNFIQDCKENLKMYTDKLKKIKKFKSSAEETATKEQIEENEKTLKEVQKI